MSFARLSKTTFRALSVLCRPSTFRVTASVLKCNTENMIKSSVFESNKITNTNIFGNFGIRKYSLIENQDAAPLINFTQMQDIVNKQEKGVDSKYIIVDVREPDEFAAGHIPNAINIPAKSSPGALGLDPEEFKLTFGFDKPSTDKTLVFYCLAGVRATMSEELAYTFGYQHRLNYVGSFREWLDNKGEIEFPKTAEETEKGEEK
jgi:rhodanese-related sulfurtransferase